MNNIIYLVKTVIISGFVLAIASTVALAGNHEDELKHEISYLAKKLLDMSGEDSITVEQPAFMKPFIGICTDIVPGGFKLTCITPGHSAAAAGLKTGDLVTSVNDIDMRDMKVKDHDNAYYKIVKSMKTGDKLSLKFVRNGKNEQMSVIVGAISHPAYTLTVKKK